MARSDSSHRVWHPTAEGESAPLPTQCHIRTYTRSIPTIPNHHSVLPLYQKAVIWVGTYDKVKAFGYSPHQKSHEGSPINTS